jgi:hypothetical protein
LLDWTKKSRAFFYGYVKSETISLGTDLNKRRIKQLYREEAMDFPSTQLYPSSLTYLPNKNTNKFIRLCVRPIYLKSLKKVRRLNKTSLATTKSVLKFFRKKKKILKYVKKNSYTGTQNLITTLPKKIQNVTKITRFTL